jgi:hypothetical protein
LVQKENTKFGRNLESENNALRRSNLIESTTYMYVICKTNKKLYLVAAGDDGEVVAGCLQRHAVGGRSATN